MSGTAIRVSSSVVNVQFELFGGEILYSNTRSPVSEISRAGIGRCAISINKHASFVGSRNTRCPGMRDIAGSIEIRDYIPKGIHREDLYSRLLANIDR